MLRERPNDRLQAKVSVLLPTFNRAAYISVAISSLLAQIHQPFEIIVLDDGSTDGTAGICRSFGDRVTYVPLERNGGKTAAINLGLSLVRGDFVWIMDDDDIVPSSALSALLAPLVADDAIGFSFGALRKFSIDDQGMFRLDEAPVHPAGPPSLFAHLMEDCFITGQPCTLFRRSCLQALAPFDTTIVASVDYNMLLQVARFNRGVDVGEVVLWQRQHNGARGPAGQEYAVTARVDRWREFDRRLIAGLMDQLDLHEYLGMRVLRRPLTAEQVRSALIQKAVIAGRKELWNTAIDSLRQAVAAEPDKALGGRHLKTLARMLGSRYGIAALLDDRKVQTGLADAFGKGWASREARIAVASLLTFWARTLLRKGDLPRVLDCLRAMVRIAGIRGAAILIASIGGRRFGILRLPNAVRRAGGTDYAAQ